MPSKKRRTRKRTRPNWPPILWLATAISVVLGILYSPLSRAQVVWVEGATQDQMPAIIKLLQSVRHQPALQVNKAKVESDVLEIDEIKSAKYTQNLFGRAVLQVVQKTPVARIGDTGAYLDEDGNIFNLTVNPKQIVPVLILNPIFTEPTLSPMARWESGRIAKICQQSSKNWPDFPAKIEVTERGVINLQPLTGGAMAVFGSSDDWEKKLAALARMVQAEPELWRRYKEVNLIDPENPMTRS